jgi:hypothetical protein
MARIFFSKINAARKMSGSVWNAEHCPGVERLNYGGFILTVARLSAENRFVV